MIGGKRILVVVPARGGSKGVPLKNIRLLAGKPLIVHTAELLSNLTWVDCAVVSTDSDQIAEVADKAGLSAPFRRPESLSGDRIGDWDVLNHASAEMARQTGQPFDVIVMLQPTSPLRKPELVTAAVERLISGGWDSVWTVSPTDLKFHPLKALVQDQDGSICYFDPRGSAIIARQQLQPTYYRNGVAYALTSQCLHDQKSMTGKRWSAVVIQEPQVSIDTVADFELVEGIIFNSNR